MVTEALTSAISRQPAYRYAPNLERCDSDAIASYTAILLSHCI